MELPPNGLAIDAPDDGRSASAPQAVPGSQTTEINEETEDSLDDADVSAAPALSRPCLGRFTFSDDLADQRPWRDPHPRPPRA